MKNWVDYIRQRKTKKSARDARDRLQIIIAQQRSQKNSSPDFLPMLRQDILLLVAKYTHVNIDEVKVELQYNDNNSVLELNVVLPDQSEKYVENEISQ